MGKQLVVVKAVVTLIHGYGQREQKHVSDHCMLEFAANSSQDDKTEVVAAYVKGERFEQKAKQFLLPYSEQKQSRIEIVSFTFS